MKFSYPNPQEVDPALLPDPALIHQALAEIIQSAPFRTTRQCQSLLRYVVEHSLSGQDHFLKERVIGAEVFGRKPDYDTGDDPVVRIRAADVRRRLAQFYQAPHAVTSVRIHMPSGSYRAQFEPVLPLESRGHEANLLGPPEFESHGTPSLPPAKPKLNAGTGISYREKWGTAAVLLLFLALGTGFALRHARAMSGQRDFDLFWAPLRTGQKPVLICLGSNAVYRLSNEFQLKYLADRHMENHGLDFFPEFPSDLQIPGHDIQPARNSFVALGDVAAASDIVAMLSRSGKAYQERFPPDISFAEVSDTPSVLIGGFNNDLTLKLTRDFRFVLAGGDRVLDRRNPQKPWVVQFYGDGRDTEDYAIISRVLNPRTGASLVSVAGIGQFGTQAAAEFVSNTQSLAALARQLPTHWNDKNMQVVLHIKVINYRPVETTVVATDSW